jgi:hypothetical protein
MDQYDEVFGKYVKELTTARATAQEWWQALMAAETQRARSAEGAERAVRPRWPMGPVSHPFVIAVYRKYYLEIEKFNEEIFERWEADETEEEFEEDETDWGEEDEDEGDEGDEEDDEEGDDESTSEPSDLLFERLEDEQPEMAEFLRPLMSAEPIGFDLGADPEWNDVAATRPPVDGLTAHNVDKGIRRLLLAPRDLPQVWPRPEVPITKSAAAPAHLRMFDAYVRDIKRAVDEAVYSWSFRIREMQEERGMNQAQAVDQAYNNFLAGPAGSPYVIWAVRKYWLACEAINKDLPIDRRVPPEVFLMSWLLGHEHQEEVQVLAQLPFWPLGMNGEGNWI